jgi:hypothetical protein
VGWRSGDGEHAVLTARLWLLRAVWVSLPLTAGTAASDALAGWSDAPKVTAAVLLWIAWAIGTVALLAPRPVGLTAVRAIAPAFALLTIAAVVAGDTDGVAGWGGVAATLLAAALASDSAIALAAVNGVAYGDERRFPLRTPFALFFGPLPLARLALVGGVVAGPLLLADERWVAGAVAVLVGVPLVVVAARALHGLSRRWLVLVPAGVVVVDPLTLADPTLFVRRQVRALRALDTGSELPPGALDLRLGAFVGGLTITLDAELDLVRSARGRRGGQTVHAASLVVAVVRRAELLVDAAQRRVRVEVR